MALPAILAAAAVVGGAYAGLSSYANGSTPDRSTDESPDATIARNRLTDLKNGFDGEYQGSQVNDYEEPSTMSDLYERVQAMNVADITTLHTRWESMRNQLEAGFKTYDAEISKAIAEKWSGNAAASAGEGIAQYVEKSGSLLTSAQMMAEKVKLVKSAAQVTKDRVQPHEGSTTSKILSYVPGPTWKMDSHNEDTAKAEGAEVVRGVFYKAVGEADTQVPKVPQPYNPVNKDTDTPGGSTKPDGSSTKPTTQQPTTQQPTTEQPTTEDPTTEDPSDDDTEDDDTSPSSTIPATTTPETPTSPTTPTSPGTTPAGTQPAGTSGLPTGGSPGGGSPAGGTPGTTQPGTPGGAGKPNGAGTGTSSGAAGRNGMSGMGGMGAGGARGKGDDDNEVATKDYLINQQNGEELTGLSEDQRVRTVPPVIGE
ncbi:hypothetical protein ACFXK0_12175 [Nocardia sp. NPDC059177]|uniref:hypothetical protein n=1 Tax=Nocardia sp. NPDC059177 TaxID=3346759 RepID=UPI00369D6ECD